MDGRSADSAGKAVCLMDEPDVMPEVVEWTADDVVGHICGLLAVGMVEDNDIDCCEARLVRTFGIVI